MCIFWKVKKCVTFVEVMEHYRSGNSEIMEMTAILPVVNRVNLFDLYASKVATHSLWNSEEHHPPDLLTLSWNFCAHHRPLVPQFHHSSPSQLHCRVKSMIINKD